MTISVAGEVQSSPLEFNVFENVPNEVIREIIGRYLTPNEVLSVRLVNKRFAVLFGDSYIWRVYYRSLGLEPPVAVPRTTCELQISNLAKKLPFWTCLRRVIDSMVKNVGENVCRQESLRSLCIAALAIPELFPLHCYAIKILEEHCNVPAGLSSDELILCVARGDRDFNVSEGARVLALKSLSMRAAELDVRQVLLSIIEAEDRYGLSNGTYCKEAVKGVVPYLTDPQVKRAVLVGLRQHGPFAVRPALDILITSPEVLDAVIDKFAGGLWGLDEIVCNHLNNASVVEKLVQRLTTTNRLHVVSVLACALKPVSDQKKVQRALCQRLVDLQPRANWHTKNALNRIISTVRLARDVQEEYRDRIPMLQEQANVDIILQLSASDNAGQRQRLLAALTSRNIFERAAAATVLAPLVPDDPEILAAFLERISAREHGEVGVIIVSALAKVAYRKDIRIDLIQKVLLDGRISSYQDCDDLAQRLATVQALRPFVNEPEVRQAFLVRLKSDESSVVRFTLMDILAPQLVEQDVRTLFLKVAKDELWRHHYHSGSKWQVAAINHLESVSEIPEVQAVLLQLFEKCSFSVKAASIRALCADQQRCLIGADKIFVASIDSSSVVRREARRVLTLWTQD